MFCKNCGTELADDAKFCFSCGSAVIAEEQPAPTMEAPVEAPVAAPETAPAAEPAQPKENPLKPMLEKLTPMLENVKPALEKVKPMVEQNKLVLAGIGCALLLVIAIAIIASVFGGGNGFITLENSIIATVNDDEVIILWNDKLIETGIEAGYIDEQSLNMDGTVLAFLTDESELYVVKGKKVTEVAEDVSYFTISVDGNGIAYVAEDGDEDCLYLYNVSKKKSTTVMEDCSYLAYYGYELSPDGKTMAYYEFDEDEFEATLMLFDGKKSIKITSSEVELLGLSNGGKYIYVLAENDDGDDVLYTYNKKGDREKIGTCTNSDVMFNADHTQVLYVNDGKTYASVKGKEGFKMSSSYASLLTAPNCVSNGNTYPVEDLFGHVYVIYDDGEYNAWTLEKNSDKSEKLVSDVSGCVLDEACEYLYYINDDDELCVLKISHGDKASDKAKVLGEDVENFVVTSDTKTVYYVADDSLYSCNAKNGKSQKTIARDDVNSYYLALNGTDVLFYVMDGDCYSCSNGKKGTKVLSDVEGIMSYANGVVYAATDDVLYVSTGSKKLTKLYEQD